jgi:hypothetical protein
MKHPLLLLTLLASLASVTGCTDGQPLAPERDQHALFSGDGAPRFSDWSEPVNLGPIVNTIYAEAGTYISRDGLSLYFGSTRPGGMGATGTFDIWVSRRTTVNDPWGPPANLGHPVNTPANEQTPMLTIDGHRLFFARDGAGGYGGQDLYVARRRNARDDSGWLEASNLGPGVNTAWDESGPALFEDEGTGTLSLYFSSVRATGLGYEDIYVSTADPGEPFGAAQLELDVSTTYRDARPFVTRDGLELYFDSNRGDGTPFNDLWVSTRSSANEPWPAAVRMSDHVQSVRLEARPVVSFDGTELFFHSNRLGTMGGNDIYVARRYRVRGPTTR